jgi:predicted GNAT family acetyltransferase
MAASREGDSMADHPLDRPVWNALSTRQRELSQGDGRALRLAPDYGTFAAAADQTQQNLAALARLLPSRGELALVEAGAVPAAPAIAVVSRAVVWQMVAEALTAAASPPDFEITPLEEADAPQMLALAALTRPGPFFERTHQLGDFVGVKQGPRLLAMAGERMKPPGFTEVSGVCTQPDCRGRGYAGALMRVVAGRILARGETPFLHSYAHNTGAIGLYRSLGFVLRREVTMSVLERAAT